MDYKYKYLKYKQKSIVLRNLFGSVGDNNIQFKFIDLNDYPDKDKKDCQLEEIDLLLKNTGAPDGDGPFFTAGLF